MNKAIIALAVAWISAFAGPRAPAGQETAKADRLIPFLAGDSWGFMDRSGKTVIPANFYEARPFHEGFALVVDLKGARGYINESGAFIWTVPKESLDKALTDYGLAAFEEALDAMRGDLGDFHEGLARVKVYSGAFQWRFGFIDKAGKYAVKPQFERAGDFSEGLAPAKNLKEAHYGYIRKDGTWAIKPQYANADSFRDGLAAVYSKEKYGYVDKSGNVVIELRFDRAGPFCEGLAKFGVLDPGRKATGFYGGSLDKLVFAGKWGYVDKTGKAVIGGPFDAAGDFSEGLAAVKKGDLWGFIDKTGKIVIKPQFDGADSFSEGLAAVNKGGKWGYVDKAGRVAIGLQFDDAFGFSDGLAEVWLGEKMGYILPSGKFFWGPSR